MRRPTVVATALGLILSAAGCGGGSEITGPAISKGAVIKHFREETGLVPHVSVVNDGDPGFSYWFSPWPQTREYGTFRIIVSNEKDQKDVESTRGTLLEKTMPDAKGISWSTYTPMPHLSDLPSKVAFATRQYGENVYLVWVGSTMGQTDRRWDRLDGILRGVAKPVFCRECLRDFDPFTPLWQPPYRGALETDGERAEYDEAFELCDPSTADLAENGRAEFIAVLGTMYGGGGADPSAIASGLAKTLVRIISTSERTPHAREIWHRACLDALGGMRR